MDKEIALEAIKQNKKALQFVEKYLILDRHFIIIESNIPKFSHLNSFD